MIRILVGLLKKWIRKLPSTESAEEHQQRKKQTANGEGKRKPRLKGEIMLRIGFPFLVAGEFNVQQ